MPRVWPFSRSLLYPLTAVLVLLAALPVLLVGWGFVRSNSEQVSTLEKQYLTRQAVGLGREIELFFVDTVGRLETVAQVVRPRSHLPGGAGEAAAALQQIVESNRRVILLRLLDESGKGPFVQSRALRPEAEEVLEARLEEAFAANLSGRPVRDELLRLPGAGAVALVSLPVMHQGGVVVASLQGVVSLDWLSARLADEAASGLVVDVIDRSGEVLFSTNPERLGKSAAGHPLVRQFMHTPVRLTTTYLDPLTPAGVQVLGSLCPVEGVPWAVVAARDLDVAFAAVRAMGQRTAVLALVTTTLAVLAGGALARRITSPLRHLAEVTTAVARGEFSRRVPVTSQNELGQLASNFNLMAAEVESYVQSLRRALRENQELMLDSIRALAAAIDAKNPYTRGHSERVSQYAVAIGRHLGLSSEEMQSLEIAAILHDVGKIGIEDKILLKPSALSEQEFAQMRGHVLKGASIVSPIKRLHEILPGIRSHHENWGGGGYPDGLVGEEIPLMARIIAAADVFDAMTTHRPYQPAMVLDSVLARVRELSGTRLDPRVVEAFFKAVRAGDLVPLGSVEVAS